jgi:hypothetical protein
MRVAAARGLQELGEPGGAPERESRLLLSKESGQVVEARS